MFSDPVKNIAQSGILPGMEVADFGAGSGAHALAVAKALMSTGRVYAIDIQQDLLSKLKNTAVREGLHNVEVIWGDIEKPNGSKLRDNSMDFVLLSNILFQVENKKNIAEEAFRILKPSGRVIVVEWDEEKKIFGPPLSHRVNRQEAENFFLKKGFIFEKEFNAGENHYGVIFKRNK